MTFIILPHGQGNTAVRSFDDGFWIGVLIRKLTKTDNGGLRLGKDRKSNYENHRYPEGLDFWLRTNFVKSSDIFQLTNDVQERILDTGFFEIREVENNLPGVNPDWIFLR